MIVTIEELWERLERWLAEHTKVDFQLNAPASEEALTAAEDTLGQPLPRHLRLSFLRHNGQPWDAPSFTALGPLRSVERLVEDWHSWNKLAAESPGLRGRNDGVTPVRAMFWNPKWLPITSAGIGEDYFVDLDPPRGGEVGQIIHLRNELATRTVVSPSYSRWLAERVEALESGMLAWSVSDARFLPVAEAEAANRAAELEAALGAVFPYAIDAEGHLSLRFLFDHEGSPCLRIEIDAPARGCKGDLELLIVPASRFPSTASRVDYVRASLDGAARLIRGGSTALGSIFTDARRVDTKAR